jgi:citrate synthase
MALRQIKVNPADFGMMVYDPGYGNTAACKSSITYIDGDKGILEYRGYPIEQLAEQSNFLEVAYLLIYGELPDQATAQTWEYKVCHHTFVHENLTDLMKSFRYDAHPMGMLISANRFCVFWANYPQSPPLSIVTALAAPIIILIVTSATRLISSICLIT